MYLGRMATINVFCKMQQLKTLTKPYGLLVRNCNAIQFPKYTSNLMNLNRCVISNVNKYTKCHILSKLPTQSVINTSHSRSISTQGDHVRLWMIERLLAASFLLTIPAAFLFENKIIDAVLAASIVMHTHWGLEAILVDYARPIVVGTLVPKVAFFMLNIVSAATLAGLLLLIYNGPGLAKIIKQGWAIGQPKDESKVE